MNQPRSRQRRSGYLLVAGGLVVLIGGVGYLLYRGAPWPSYLGIAVAAGILLAVGYRNVAAGGEVSDEHRARVATEAGNIAFWFVMGVLVLDGAFQLTPDEGVRTIYMAIGLVALALGFGLAKFAPLRRPA